MYNLLRLDRAHDINTYFGEGIVKTVDDFIGPYNFSHNVSTFLFLSSDGCRFQSN